jgi:hypothetical protein
MPESWKRLREAECFECPCRSRQLRSIVCRVLAECMPTEPSAVDELRNLSPPQIVQVQRTHEPFTSECPAFFTRPTAWGESRSLPACRAVRKASGALGSHVQVDRGSLPRPLEILEHGR